MEQSFSQAYGQTYGQAGQTEMTANQSDFARQQETQATNRNKNMQGIQDWEQSRNPYYASLYNSQIKSGNAQAQQDYNDSLKRLQLQHIGRGTRGGSQELFNQSQLGGHYQQAAARNAQQAQNHVQGIRGRDQDRASMLRMEQYNEDPVMASYYDSLKRSNRYETGGYESDIANSMAIDRINQGASNEMSQIYGQAINQGMQGAQSYFGGGM